METSGLAILAMIVLGSFILAAIGTVMELVVIWRRKGDRLRRTGSWFIMKVFLFVGAALMGGC
jgi:hypothetical protein